MNQKKVIEIMKKFGHADGQIEPQETLEDFLDACAEAFAKDRRETLGPIPGSYVGLEKNSRYPKSKITISIGSFFEIISHDIETWEIKTIGLNDVREILDDREIDYRGYFGPDADDLLSYPLDLLEILADPDIHRRGSASLYDWLAKKIREG